MSTDLERELERGTQLRGFRSGMHDFLGHMGGAEALKKHNDHVEANLYRKDSPVDRKTRELAIIVALVAQKDSVPHLQLHMHAAHKAGASPEEILALINLLGEHIGVVSKNIGVEAWRATFRPDIPTILRVVELR